MGLLDRVKIHHSIVYDFLTGMYRLNNNDQLIKNMNSLEIETRYKYNEEILKWVENTRAKVPENIQEKLDRFFNKETFYGLCLAFLIPLHDIKKLKNSLPLSKKRSMKIS